MSVVLQVVILVLLLGVVPFLAGGIPEYMGKQEITYAPHRRWVSGQFLLWAGFQLICVPLILKQEEFETVEYLYLVYQLALILLAAALGMRRRARAMSLRIGKPRDTDGIENASFLWMIFLLLLLFQLVQAVRLTYADGDDAYYVAISSITDEAGSMYRKLPYTGGTTELDVRHGLAPFPIWVAFLARMSGMPAVTVAHVALPVMLITVTYSIFALLGEQLFPERDGRLPLFLIFTEILVLFGDYSYYTAENFMIARSRQGKAALGSIVIPFMLYLLLLLLGRLEKKERVPASWYLLFFAAGVTACLCSTLGALLVCMLAGITGIAGAICYREKRFLFPMALMLCPCVLYALVYLFY